MRYIRAFDDISLSYLSLFLPARLLIYNYRRDIGVMTDRVENAIRERPRAHRRLFVYASILHRRSRIIKM